VRASLLADIGTTTWQIDPAVSTAQVWVRHILIPDVKGEFTRISGTLELNGADISRSRVQATIDAASIRTGSHLLDEHLRGPAFFDTARFPTLSFSSTQVARTGLGELSVDGELNIRGLVRPVILTVEGPELISGEPGANPRLILGATTHINRREFGLLWNPAREALRFLAGELVGITLDLQCTRS